MQGLVLGQLHIDVLEAGDRLLLKWVGSSNGLDPAKGLGPFFKLVLAEATTRQLVVEMHFEELSYFNSATITALMRILKQLHNAAVQVELYYDASARWQSHSFEAISTLAEPDGLLLVLKVGSKPPPERIIRH